VTRQTGRQQVDFQSRGPAVANDRSPTVTHRDGRTSRRLAVDERRRPRRLDGRSATYTAADPISTEERRHGGAMRQCIEHTASDCVIGQIIAGGVVPCSPRPPLPFQPCHRSIPSSTCSPLTLSFNTAVSFAGCAQRVRKARPPNGF